jgi:hypothetical protein
MPSVVNDDDSQSSSCMNMMKSNKPIRILKRPTSQSQLPKNNDVISSSTITANTTMNNTNVNTMNSASPNNVSSSTSVPVISIIPRDQAKDSTNSQLSNMPTFAIHTSTTQSTKPPIKTYEQRELEYRLARLR